MDNSDFLSFFSGLSEECSNEQIMKSAQMLVDTLDSRMKFEKNEKNHTPDPVKYKLYLKICENPNEDLLYTIRRLIGGIASTGIPYRKGFALAFALIIEKMSSVLNFAEVINAIEKETIVSKSEKNHIKNCALSGKVLLYRLILQHFTLIPPDIALRIFKILFELLLSVKFLEEAILLIISDFLQKAGKHAYVNITLKKLIKFSEGFLNLIDKNLIEDKQHIENSNYLSAFGIIFILLSNSNAISSFKSFLPTNIQHQLFSEEPSSGLVQFIKLLLQRPIRENEFHISLGLLFSLLKDMNSAEYAYKFWNLLIDPNFQNQFKNISAKNYEYLIYKSSKFILENFFILKYIQEIFDDSFFISLTRFSNKRKNIYATSLFEILSMKLDCIEDSQMQEIVPSYCFNLLKIFGGDPSSSYSPSSFKNVFLFLFNHLTKEKKTEFIDYLSKRTTEENEDEDDIINSMLFKIAAMKTLITSSENIDEEMREKIIEYFLIRYYNWKDEEMQDAELEMILEDRLILVLLSLFKPSVKVNKDNRKEIVAVSNGRIMKMLMKVHKMIQGMIRTSKIRMDDEDYKSYEKYYKKCVSVIKQKSSDREYNDKIYSIAKLSLVILILYLKNPNEYSDILSDLSQIAKFDSNWTQVYTDLTLSILHKGNSIYIYTLSDLTLNIFKKLSKFIDIHGIQVILQFLADFEGNKDSRIDATISTNEMEADEDEDENEDKHIDEI